MGDHNPDADSGMQDRKQPPKEADAGAGGGEESGAGYGNNAGSQGHMGSEDAGASGHGSSGKSGDTDR